ncbi:TPA: fimbrial protein [Citrobacter koseri]
MNAINCVRLSKYITLVILSFTTNYDVHADTDMNFHGTLIEAPPCTINNDADVFIEFGDTLGVGKIDGINYRKTVDAPIICELGASLDNLNIVFSGNPTSFDASAVVAIQENSGNQTDLGIRIFCNGAPVTFNESIPVDPLSPPDIEAVPVKMSGASLSEGHFSAIATIRLEYL